MGIQAAFNQTLALTAGLAAMSPKLQQKAKDRADLEKLQKARDQSNAIKQETDKRLGKLSSTQMQTELEGKDAKKLQKELDAYNTDANVLNEISANTQAEKNEYERQIALFRKDKQSANAYVNTMLNQNKADIGRQRKIDEVNKKYASAIEKQKSAEQRAMESNQLESEKKRNIKQAMKERKALLESKDNSIPDLAGELRTTLKEGKK